MRQHLNIIYSNRHHLSPRWMRCVIRNGRRTKEYTIQIHNIYMWNICIYSQCFSPRPLPIDQHDNDNDVRTINCNLHPFIRSFSHGGPFSERCAMEMGIYVCVCVCLCVASYDYTRIAARCRDVAAFYVDRGVVFHVHI